MNEIQATLLSEANYHKGVADGMTRALQLINQENEEKIEQTQEKSAKWFDDAEEEKEDAEE